MSGRPPSEHQELAGGASAPGVPRWVKAFALATLVLIVIVVVVMLTGGGGGHGPGRHLPPAGAAISHPPALTGAILRAPSR